jgi:hypothetical protein
LTKSRFDFDQFVPSYLLSVNQPITRKKEAMNNTSNKPLFALGAIVGTPGALELLESAGKAPSEFIAKHVSGNWGDALCDEDRELNDAALKEQSRLFSAYTVGNEKIWVITEADRSSTTLLLPSDY